MSLLKAIHMKKITYILFFLLTLQSYAQCWYLGGGGFGHTSAVRVDGTLWSWGWNAAGQLGDGSFTDKSIPTQIGTGVNWGTVYLGFDHTIALTNDGEMWAWGNNDSGQLGIGNNTSSNIPVRVGTDNGWRAVACGNSFTIAIRYDGTLWSFGSDSAGQLGNGAATNQNLPVQIGTAFNWSVIAAGANHVVARKSDGSLWTWGSDFYGQLGNGGSGQNEQSPIQIGTGALWMKVAAGQGFSAALKMDGTLWTWGDNEESQLGDGSTTNRNIPTAIGSDTDWTNLAAGYNHIMALKWSGSLWGWGSNNGGQLGDGTNNNRSVPTQIGTDTNWTKLGGGGFHTIVTKLNDGELYSTGQNNFGQLGDGTFDNNTALTGIGCTLATVESELALFGVYPNPVSATLHIDAKQGQVIEKIEVADISGKKVISQSADCSSLDLVQLQKGLYLVQIFSNGKSEVFKVIKD